MRYCINTKTTFDSSQLRLNLRLVDLVALAVKPDLPLAPQTLLQRQTDLNSLIGTLKINRNILISEHSVCELVRLSHERLLEALVVVLRNGALDSVGEMCFHEVGHGVRIDGELALCADYLRRVVLAGCVHARAVEVRDLAVVEFHHADAVVDIAVLGEVGLESCHTEGDDGLDLGQVFAVGVGAEVPQCQVDIMDVLTSVNYLL